jgi:hypothetical protein
VYGVIYIGDFFDYPHKLGPVGVFPYGDCVACEDIVWGFVGDFNSYGGMV